MIHEQCVLVPMRDGVRLAVEVWRPDEGVAPVPGLVFRTPYGRQNNPFAAHVEQGFCVIIADARGTGASEGDYDYYNLEAGTYDGYDLIEWLAEQPFCNGRIAAVGGSALGIYAITAAAQRPPHLEAMLLNVVPADFYQHQWYPGGVRREESRRGWCLGTVNRCAPGAVWDQEGAADTIQRNYKSELFAKRYQQFPENPLAWSEAYFAHQERDALWEQIDLTKIIKELPYPILFSGVHFDHFGKGTIAAHAAHNGPKHLSMQSGPVSDPLEKGGWAYPWDQTLAWLKYYLCDEGDCPAGGEQWYLTGAEHRVRLPEGRKTEWKSIHLDGELTLKHDPQSPALSNVATDFLDWSPFLAQQQVSLIELNCPVDEIIIGHPVLRFSAHCSHPEAQLTARFCIKNNQGRVRMLNLGARKLFLNDAFDQRLAFNDGMVQSSLEFWTIAHQMQEGESICLALSISDSPCWDHPQEAMAITISECALEYESLDQATIEEA